MMSISRRIFCLMALVSGLITALILPMQTVYAKPDQAQSPPVYIVVMKAVPDAKQEALALAQSHGAIYNYHAVFQGFAAPLNDRARQALANNPMVELIQPDFVVHAISLDNSNAEVPDGVDRIDAEKAHAADALGAGVRVAIVDTGIDYNHPDLSGQVDVALSRTHVRGKSTKNGLDDHGHGTHVAGTVAAVADGAGVLGVAPQTTLISFKVLDKKGSGWGSDIIKALDDITAHNSAAATYADMIHIANFSLGGTGSDTDSAYRRAFEAAVASGCFVVVAAGNESDDAANHIPAAYDSVFTVSAINPANDSFASFSNYGADVDISSPGVNIRSTVLNGGYASWNGTSMATPHVVGTAALYVGRNIDALSVATAVTDIRTALNDTAELVAGLADPLVDAEAVVTGAVSDPGVTPPPEPTPDPGVLSMYVSAIDYKLNKKHLVVSISVTDSNGNPVDAATVVTTLNRDGVPIGTASGQTSGGKVSFRLRGASKGFYTSTINSVSKDGVEYDTSQNAVDPGITI